MSACIEGAKMQRANMDNDEIEAIFFEQMMMLTRAACKYGGV
jgi:hypothetical protein